MDTLPGDVVNKIIIAIYGKIDIQSAMQFCGSSKLVDGHIQLDVWKAIAECETLRVFRHRIVLEKCFTFNWASVSDIKQYIHNLHKIPTVNDMGNIFHAVLLDDIATFKSMLHSHPTLLFKRLYGNDHTQQTCIFSAHMKGNLYNSTGSVVETWKDDLVGICVPSDQNVTTLSEEYNSLIHDRINGLHDFKPIHIKQLVALTMKLKIKSVGTFPLWVRPDKITSFLDGLISSPICKMKISDNLF